MLVLHRKTDECIVIGENIFVTVFSVRGGRVKLGIEAPKKVNIRRSEVCRSETPVADAEFGK